MKTWLVTWECDVEARTPVAAARKARKMIRAHGGVATVYKVFDGDGESTSVDLTEIENGDGCPACGAWLESNGVCEECGKGRAS